MKVQCYPGGGWGTSVVVDFCGVFGTATDGSRSVGARWRVTNQAVPPLPSVTTCWIAYRFVAKTAGDDAGPILYTGC